jgi:hypothetical protein
MFKTVPQGVPCRTEAQVPTGAPAHSFDGCFSLPYPTEVGAIPTALLGFPGITSQVNQLHPSPHLLLGEPNLSVHCSYHSFLYYLTQLLFLREPAQGGYGNSNNGSQRYPCANSFLVLFCLRKGLTHFAQAGLELRVLLPQLPECWDYRSAPPHLAPHPDSKYL